MELMQAGQCHDPLAWLKVVQADAAAVACSLGLSFCCSCWHRLILFTVTIMTAAEAFAAAAGCQRCLCL